jgi:hypothetical protein
MLINLIVGAVTLLVGALVVAWCVSPKLRAALEQPKYDLERRERRFNRARGEHE